jgi:hypothetical protein
MGVEVAVLTGNSNSNTIDGTFNNDSIDGLGGDDIVDGDDGKDKIYGGDGWDFLDGGDDDDRIFGGAGEDWLIGGYGNDFLSGGAGFDSFQCEPGNDTYDGGSIPSLGEEDTDGISCNSTYVTQGVIVNFATGVVRDGTGGTDVLADIEEVAGSRFADRLIGGNVSNNDYEYFEGGDGADTIISQGRFPAGMELSPVSPMEPSGTASETGIRFQISKPSGPPASPIY